METNFGRVIMIRHKCSLIWCYSSGQQLQNERILSRYSGLLIFKLSVSLSVGVCEHIVIVARTLAPCCVTSNKFKNNFRIKQGGGVHGYVKMETLRLHHY